MALDPAAIRRRVKAARALAGYRAEDLAAALPEDAKLGERTLRTLESDKAPRPFRQVELLLIAQACGVSPAFFEVDFRTLGQESDSDRMTDLEERVSFLAEFLLENVVPTLGEDEHERLAEQLQERGDAPAGRTGRRRNQPPLAG